MPEKEKNPVHGLYRRLLGEAPGEGAAAFIRNLGWISASFVIAKLISSVTNIAAGRALGPQEYGRINVLVSTGAAISPFLLMGLNYSVIKYGTAADERGRVFTTFGAVFLCLTLLAVSVIVPAAAPLSSFLKISPEMLFLAAAYSIGMSAFILTSSMQQAAGSFAKRGLSEIMLSVLLVSCFIAGLFHFGRSYKAMAWAYIAAFSSLAAFWMIRIGSRTELALLGRARFLKMSEYGVYYFGSAVGIFLMMNVQTLILNFFLAPAEVGIYAAYSTASIGVSGYIGYAVGTVLFPKASASTNRRRLWEMGARVWTRVAPGAALFFLAAEAAVLLLMGRHQYGMDPLLMCLFACGATLMLAYNSMAQIVFSEGVRASRLAMAMSLAGGALNFTACLVLVPRLNIAGAVLAFIITYGVLFAWIWKIQGDYLTGPADLAGQAPPRP